MTAPQPPKTYGDQRRTAQEIAALPPGEQREYIERYMSPQDRYDYLQANAGAQYADDPWFSRAFEQMKAQERAEQQANQYGQQSVQQATGSDTQYVTGLAPSGTDYQGIDHSKLQAYVDSGLDAGQIGTMSSGYHQMSGTFDQIAQTLINAVNKSQSQWEGDAAESARGYFTSLQQWADGNSQNARLASEVTYQQSSAASTAKNSMPTPVPFSWTAEMAKWGSNPFAIIDNVKASMEKV